MNIFKLLLLTSLLILSTHLLAQHRKPQLPHIYYVSFPVYTPIESLTVSAQYRVPRGPQSQPLPAVIIIHSSGGVDSTGNWYAQGLNRLGIATLEIDMWSARELGGGTNDRPQTLQETMPDAYAALAYLASRPEIDANKIGLMGFSWGAVVTMLASTQPYYDLMGDGSNQFASFVAHYPLCWLYNHPQIAGFEYNQLVGKRVLIQVGAKDDYEADKKSCTNFVTSLSDEMQDLIQVKVYQGAHHGWDRLEQKITVFDQFGNRGQGAMVDLIPNQGIAIQSRRRVGAFFKQTLHSE